MVLIREIRPSFKLFGVDIFPTESPTKKPPSPVPLLPSKKRGTSCFISDVGIEDSPMVLHRTIRIFGKDIVVQTKDDLQPTMENIIMTKGDDSKHTMEKMTTGRDDESAAMAARTYVSCTNPIQEAAKSGTGQLKKNNVSSHVSRRSSCRKPRSWKAPVIALDLVPTVPPADLAEEINLLRGTDTRLVIRKTLTKSDADRTQARLSMPVNRVMPLSHRDLESSLLEYGKNKLAVTVIDPSRKGRFDLSLTKWNYPTTSSYVLHGRAWCDLARLNLLVAGVRVDVWSFRVEGKLTFAIDADPDRFVSAFKWGKTKKRTTRTPLTDLRESHICMTNAMEYFHMFLPN